MRLRNSLVRTDWLRELQGLLVVGIVFVALWAGVAGVSGLAGRAVNVDVPVDAVGTAWRLPAGAEVADGATVTLHLTDPSISQRLWSTVRDLVPTVVVLALLVMLFLLVRSARRTNPFTEPAVRRLRWLAGVAVAGGTLAGLVESFAAVALSMEATQGRSGVTEWTYPALWLLAGFGFLAVGEILQRGRAMRTELDEII